MKISMSRPRLVAVGVLSLLGALSACSGSTSDGDGAPRQRVPISMLPPISQQGDQPADPDDAQPVVSARFEPGSAGRVATLERRSAQGWEEADTAEIGPAGAVAFPIEAGSRATYRVATDATGDLPAARSGEVEAGAPGTLDFTDTFDGDALLPAWFARGLEYNPEGYRACSKGSEDAIEVTGGELLLKVLRDTSRTDTCVAKKANGKTLGRYPYRLNGHVATGPDYPILYGITAARIKFQRAKGQHGSFWLQAGPSGATNAQDAGAEIDVVEYFGDDSTDRLASFIHYPTEDGGVKEGDWIENASGFLAGKNDDWWKSYHVFSVEWTEDEYIIRIDGDEAWRTDQGVSQTAEFIVLSLLSSDYELPNLGTASLPQVMRVDWVRHWQPVAG